MRAASARIAALYYYPVKSCRGLELEEAALTAAGLEHDRRWMITDASGRFYTQREMPRLALLSPSLSADTLQLDAPGMASLAIALAQRAQAAACGSGTMSAPRWMRAMRRPLGRLVGSAARVAWCGSIPTSAA